jgi:hypothetical protein
MKLRIRLLVLLFLVWCVPAGLLAGDVKRQMLNLEFGKTLHLIDHGGPHFDLIVTSVDIANVSIVTYDFEKMVARSVPVGNNPAYAKVVTVPTSFRGQIAKGTGASHAFSHSNTLLADCGHMKVYLVDDISTPNNAVRIGIIGK